MENFCQTFPHVTASLIPGLLPGNLLSSSGVSVKFPFLFRVDVWLFYFFNADLSFEEKHVFLSFMRSSFLRLPLPSHLFPGANHHPGQKR